MATNELLNKIEALNEWEQLMQEAKEMADSIRDELKQYMLNENTEELECGQYILRYQTIVTNRFDNSSFKKLMPDVYNSFIRQTTSRRFSVA